MGDRSNVNIITEARANGTNVGINVYLHWSRHWKPCTTPTRTTRPE